MAEQRNQTPAGDNTQWTTIIRPRTGWFDVDLEELWRYRDLIVMFVKRNFTVMYKQTILGPLWIILNPLITTVLFNVVFGGIAGQMGDLFASMVKRHCKIKDFGHIFPGHGGMLDRLDSVLMCAPMVFLFFYAVHSYVTGLL